MPSRMNQYRHHTQNRPQVPQPIAMVWNLAQEEKLEWPPQMPQPQAERLPVASLEMNMVDQL